MPHEVIMPALGMAQDTGLLVAWHKAPGDAVAPGDVLFEVETDKATMEVEAQASGFLTDVSAEAGKDVPVGQVIALISDSATSSATPATASPAPAAAPEDAPEEALPEGKDVIMPTLGMAQDTGLLVAWHKAAGDAVKADDILFEVETDKSTVEVNAGHDGFVAALLAEEGENVPVGQTIAIISTDKPAKPVSRSSSAAPAQVAPAASTAPPSVTAPEPPKPAPAPAARSADGRILASPKARRLAMQQGLDLGRLVAAGYPQPFHAKDIETLKALPVAADTATATAASARRLTAEVPAEGFGAFCDWAAKEAGLKDSDALLAGLAAASLDAGAVTIGVQTFDRDRMFRTDGGLRQVETVTEGAPDLVLRDLRFTRVASLALGAEEQPVLTLTANGTGLSLTLECAASHLAAAQAITLLSAFAGRMEQPLRHLL
jgi:pyruvate dehydrogenase E2 component (dihydrolipoamide acetyltransferase)/2-oxoglutarate dehydrogenase E2 component (dihydrolipoamide succinyltransferase)